MESLQRMRYGLGGAARGGGRLGAGPPVRQRERGRVQGSKKAAQNVLDSCDNHIWNGLLLDGSWRLLLDAGGG
jgi:hypothetical protein